MKKILTFLGDVHGKFKQLPTPLIYEKMNETIIQVGDMGIGFGAKNETKLRLERPNFYFIRGNHDNPARCKKYKSYLGDFGFLEEFNLFFFGGAHSIDQAYRTEGVDWWPSEEQSIEECHKALDAYEKAKPEIVVSHDGPSSLFSKDAPMSIRNFQSSRTSQVLQDMLEIHAPKLWVFGHHHTGKTFFYNKCLFRCLGELQKHTSPIVDF